MTDYPRYAIYYVPAANDPLYRLGARTIGYDGFTGSARTWGPFARRWPGMRMIAVDLIGHKNNELKIPAGVGNSHYLIAVLFSVTQSLQGAHC